jgi:hypothetical protein
MPEVLARVLAKCLKVIKLWSPIASTSARRCCSYSSVRQVFYGSALIEYQTV